MVDWNSHADPIAMGSSTLLVVVAGVVFAWAGYDATDSIPVVEALVGAAVGVVAVLVQTWAAIHDWPGKAALDRIAARAVLGASAGVLAILALTAVPAVVAGFGVALIPAGLLSRTYLYRRANRGG